MYNLSKYEIKSIFLNQIDVLEKIKLIPNPPNALNLIR